MDENHFVERQRGQVVESKGTRYSDSVLCLGQIHEHPHSTEAWQQTIAWFVKSREYRDFNGIDGDQSSSSGISSEDTLRWMCLVRSKGQ